MRYSNVSIEAITYALPEQAVRSAEIERELKPAYRRLGLAPGLIEHLTGIQERRWWPVGTDFLEHAVTAADNVVQQAGIHADDIGSLVYAGVYRNYVEPSVASRIAGDLALSHVTQVYDVSNACLGMLNGLITTANAIELGQIEFGLVVAAESSREITVSTIKALNEACDGEEFWRRFAVFTGGSGAAAILLKRSEDGDGTSRLLGGVTRAASQHHRLSHWGWEVTENGPIREMLRVDSLGTLQHGLELAAETWPRFMTELGWQPADVEKVVCHQVGREHQDRFLERIGLEQDRAFSTYQHLGNIGSVSLPLTAATAVEHGVIQPGDAVGLLGIGSGLNCAMIGVCW